MMGANCPLCGRHLSLEEARDRENTAIAPNGVEIVICSNCGKTKKELSEKLRRASAFSPSQINLFKTKDNAEIIELIKRESKWKEQITPTEPTKPLKCPEDEEWSDELHQCVKKKESPPRKTITEQVMVPYQPAPEIPAQPVISVGPITVEQKIAALENEIAKIKLDIANILGLLGQREGKR